MNREQQPVQVINVHQLQQALESNQNTTLIDVREDDEWAQAHIPGAIHLQKDILPQFIDKVVKDKTQTIYLQCRSGVRSMFAAQALIEQGYDNVYNVEGGLLAWLSAGFSVESDIPISNENQ
tara:strand:+ start:120 stop:485 length:366 start_codon:yes stop_codon:yes gene_type:complete